MKNKYYEVVFEAHYNAINGLLNGFLIAKNQEWEYYFSKKVGVKTETFGEIILDWITLSAKLHHVVMNAEFYEEFDKAIKTYNSNKDNESKFVNTKYIKSAQVIKDSSLEFEAKTYGKKYGIEIKALLNNIPNGIELHNYNPIEKDKDEGKGIELYAPEHNYVFEATGTLTGDINELIAFRKILDDHPLIEVKDIILKF